MIAFWATPEMSQGHLLFAAMTTAYMLVGIQFEERDHARAHGDSYREYQKEVSMILPIPKRKS
jgi:protein-S-isoprenylcysteine O-methyltransferase Ste14